MKKNNLLYFNGHYFFSKDELTEHITCISSSKEELNRELADLYYCGAFKKFLDLPIIDDIDYSGAISAIKEALNIRDGLSININQYISIHGVSIKSSSNVDLQINNNGNQRYEVTSNLLDRAMVESSESYYLFTFSFDVVRTINQHITPILVYKENDEVLKSYSFGQCIDLSKRIHNGLLSIKIPSNEIIPQNGGEYDVFINASSVVNIVFPRVQLCLGSGIKSFNELLTFCMSLEGNPSNDLLGLYTLVKSGTVESWIQDYEDNKCVSQGKTRRGSEIKKAMSQQICEWKNEKHEMTINDLNRIMEIFGLEKRLYFDISDYLDVTIENVYSKDIIDQGNIVYYFIWNAKNDVDISLIIEPRANLNIDFCLGLNVGGISLGSSISFNLKNITQINNHKLFSCKCSEFSKQKVGSYPVNIVNRETGCTSNNNPIYFIITGEQIKIPLSDNVSLTMIGIYRDGMSDIYVSQTPLTQKQFIAIKNIQGIPEATKLLFEKCLLESQELYGNESELPMTHLPRAVCNKLNSILTSINRTKKIEYQFNYIDDFFDALDGEQIYNASRNALPRVMTGNPPTKLQIYDLVGSVLVHLEQTYWGKNIAVFGCTYNMECNGREESLEQVVNGETSLRYVGFRPVMF